jgi:hypothetical protein
MSGFAGAIIAIPASFLGIWWTYRLNDKAALASEKSRVDRFILSAYDETKMLIEDYRAILKDHIIEPDKGNAFFSMLAVSHANFALYESSAHIVASIKDNETRQLIISLYNSARLLNGAIELNNKTLQNLGTETRSLMNSPVEAIYSRPVGGNSRLKESSNQIVSSYNRLVCLHKELAIKCEAMGLKAIP